MFDVGRRTWGWILIGILKKRKCPQRSYGRVGNKWVWHALPQWHATRLPCARRALMGPWRLKPHEPLPIRPAFAPWRRCARFRGGATCTGMPCKSSCVFWDATPRAASRMICSSSLITFSFSIQKRVLLNGVSMPGNKQMKRPRITSSRD